MLAECEDKEQILPRGAAVDIGKAKCPIGARQRCLVSSPAGQVDTQYQVHATSFRRIKGSPSPDGHSPDIP
jgi:hypothetical protein